MLTLPQFAICLGLYDESEVSHRLFAVYFGKLEVDDEGFDHEAYWN